MKPAYSTPSPAAEITADCLSFDLAEALDLDATLHCGQAFRWRPCGDGSFSGVVDGEIIRASLQGTRLVLSGTQPAKAAFWSSYFALDLDYAAIRSDLCKNPVLRQCLAFAPGIRVLRQPFFETLITFMISQNNNIPRIKGIVDRLCRCMGSEIGTDFDGAPAYSFPDAPTLASSRETDLCLLRAGYRVPGILDAARRVAAGELDETSLRTMPLDSARTALLETYGVGPKIADCVLLYGLGRFDSFPVDVWIRRAMSILFPNGLPRNARPVAGIAQQYIFHYARTTGLK
jgi:N-glycosylase/DNA lyase